MATRDHSMTTQLNITISNHPGTKEKNSSIVMTSRTRALRTIRSTATGWVAPSRAWCWKMMHPSQLLPRSCTPSMNAASQNVPAILRTNSAMEMMTMTTTWTETMKATLRTATVGQKTTVRLKFLRFGASCHSCNSTSEAAIAMIAGNTVLPARAMTDGKGRQQRPRSMAAKRRRPAHLPFCATRPPQRMATARTDRNWSDFWHRMSTYRWELTIQGIHQRQCSWTPMTATAW
mmetsp:Transcript_7983/g.22936  ORF Transcript_7983/g.22936 Transcript_7983/m.22936 type:complete len:233 (+) Transcript_7983:1612-2310(+)